MAQRGDRDARKVGRNIGQDSFDDTIDRNYGIEGLGKQSDSAPDFTAPQDYSATKDYSIGNNQSRIANNLRDSEQHTDANNQSSRDIGQQERGGWRSTENSLGSAIQKQKSNPSGGFFKRHKKGVAGWLIGIVMGGGMFSIGTVVSGPAQLLQMSNFVKEVKMWINGTQTGLRYMYSMSNMYEAFKNGNSTRIQNSRLNAVSRRVAKAFESKLSDRGLSFDSNAFGDSNSLTIDTTKEFGGNLFNENAQGGSGWSEDKRTLIKKKLGERYDIDPSKFYLDKDGKITFNLDDLSQKEARRVMYAVEQSGRFNMISKISSRLMLTKIGKLSVLHPIKNLKKQALNDLDEFIKRAINNIENGTLDLAEDAPNRDAARQKAEDAKRQQMKKTNENLPDSEKLSTEAIEEAVDKAGKAAEEAFDDALDTKKGSLMQRGVIKIAEKIGGDALKKALSTIMKGAAKGGIATLILTALCMLQDSLDNAGPYKMQSVITAIAAAMSFMGTASSVMTGSDENDNPVTMEIVGNAVNMYLGSEIDTSEVDANGQTTTTTTFQSAWNASPVKCELGEGDITDCAAGEGATDDQMPAGLRGNSSSGFAFFPQVVNDALQFLLTGSANPISALCWVSDRVSDAMDVLTGWLTGPLMDMIMNSALGSWLATMMQSLQSVLYGKLLSSETLQSMTPTGWGFVIMYGAKFADNAQNSTFGTTLSDSQSSQLDSEQKEFLAWQQSQKSLLARLFDPTDYSSTINQIARATNIDTSSQDIMTQLSNVGKMFAATPKIFAAALSIIGGRSAYAEPYASAMTYDYDTPTIALSSSEMEKITGGDKSYDYMANIEKVLGPNGNDGLAADAGIQDKMKTCMPAVSVSATGDVTFNSNEDGTTWNYVTLKHDDACQSDDMLHMKTYVLDYSNFTSADCYENDGWSDGSESTDSCSEMGFTTSSSSASSGGTAGTTPLEPLDQDSTSVACADGTTDLGEYDEAHFSKTGKSSSKDSKTLKIRLCGISNIKNPGGEFVTNGTNKDGTLVMNSRVSGAYYAMAEAAKADGITLTAGTNFGGLRSNKTQAALYKADSSTAAAPGYSNHETGYAVDFDLPGTSGSSTRQNSAEYKWLMANSKDYGLCRLSSEDWHWQPCSLHGSLN